MADFLNRMLEPLRPPAVSSAGIIARYPSNVENVDQPFVFFTKHRARYTTASGSAPRVDMVTSGHVSLYMPMGFAINDQAVFETAATGAIGGLVGGADPRNMTKADVTAIAMNSAESLGQAAGGAAGSAAGVLGGRVSGIVGGILGAVGAGTVATAIAQEYNKQAQVAINPREFMLYKSPGMRNFSFRFRFIPDSENESKAAEKIIEIAPVLMLTAFSQKELVDRARDAGVMAYVVKPFSINDLLPAIEIAISRHRQMKSLEAEVADIYERLETRKIIDRAKGILMKAMNLSEPESFSWIQKTAMDRRISMKDVAKAVISPDAAPDK